MNKLINLRLAPSPESETPKGRDEAVEGLRGYAALAVLYTHLTAPNVSPQFPFGATDPLYIPSDYFWRIENGQQMVLLFFILSGYVIGLTNREPARRASITGYLKRRALRLWPIYIIAVVCGWLAVGQAPIRVFLGNLFFLQNPVPDNPFGIPLLEGNLNLWSLHYEVIYYLLFIGLWWFKPRLLPLLITLLVLCCLGLRESTFGYWLPRLAVGLAFWMAGLLAAWYLPQNKPDSGGAWPSALLMCLALWKMMPLSHLLNRAEIYPEWFIGTSITFLDSLAPLLWLFLIISRRQTPWRGRLEFFCWFYLGAYLAWRLAHGSIRWDGQEGTAVLLFALAAILRPWKPGLAFFRWLSPVGAISYGIYALGAPIQYWVRDSLSDFSGTPSTWTVRLVTCFGITLLVAWALESKFLPFLKNRWLGQRHTLRNSPAQT